MSATAHPRPLPEHPPRPATTWGAVWRAPALTTTDILGVECGLAAAAAWRSYDYVSGGPGTLGVIEDALDPNLWGIACMMIAVLLLYGMAARRHLAVYLGHGWGACVYFALSVGSIGNAIRTVTADNAVDYHRDPSPLWWALVVMLGAVTPIVWIAQRVFVPSRPRASWWVVTAGAATGGLITAAAFVPLDEVRYIMQLVLLFVLHVLFAARGGPTPLDDGDAVVTSAVVEPKE